MRFNTSCCRHFQGSILCRLALALVTALLFAGCSGEQGGKNGANVGVPSIPAKMIQYLNNGSWRVTLTVFDSQGSNVHQEEMSVNQESGAVTTPGFYLQPGVDYRFIVVMYYRPEGPGAYELPVGFVAKFTDVSGDLLNVTWTDGDIFIQNVALSADIVAKVAANYIPNLDFDSDTISNYHEIRAGSDPRNPDSVPQPPRVVGDLKVINPTNSLDFEVTFEDPLGVTDLRPAGELACGHHDWQTEDLSAGDKTLVKLKGHYNLHAHDFEKLGLQTLSIKIQASNELGFSQEHSFDNLSFAKDGNPSRWGPEIRVKRPQPYETVSAQFLVEVEACDEDGILSVEPLGAGVVEDIENAYPELFTGNIDVKNLEDNATEIKFKALAINQPKYANRALSPANFEKIASVPLQVEADNEIQITPAPGEPIRDRLTVTADVDFAQVPDIIDIGIESITLDKPELAGFFEVLKEDNNNAKEGFKGQLKSLFFADDKVGNEVTLTINYIAKAKSRTIKRAVTYKINNGATINSFNMLHSEHALNPCLLGDDQVKLTWKINGWNVPAADPNKAHILLDDVSQGLGENSKAIVDEVNAVAFNCEPSYYDGNANYNQKRLKAIRVGLDKDGYPLKEFFTEKNLAYTPLNLTNLPSLDNYDIDQRVAAPSAPLQLYLEPTNGEDPAQFGALRWELTLSELSDDGLKIPVKFKDNAEKLQGTGLTITLNEDPNKVFKPRKKYELALRLINSQGKVISTHEPWIFYTGDVSLMGWWKFDKPSSYEPENQNYLRVFNIPQYSGAFYTYNYDPVNFVWSKPNPNSFLVDGLEFLSDLPLNGISSSSFNLGNNGFSFEVLVKFNDNIDKHIPYAFIKRGDFALGYNSGKYQVILGFANNCNEVITKGLYDANGGNMGVQDTGISVTAGDWHHLVVTYSQGDQLRFYLDGGVESYSQKLNKPLSHKQGCSSGIVIGYRAENFLDALHATVGEMSYYNYVISAQRAKELCKSSYPAPTCAQ